MKNLLTLAFLAIATAALSQDTIVRIDSSRVIGVVKTVGTRKITYVRYSDQDGAVYEVSRHHIARIAYADGTRETYGKTDDEKMATAHPNIVSITTTDIVTGVFTLNYERLVGSDLGLRVTASMGALGVSGVRPDYSGGHYYYSRYKLFSFAGDIRYYAYRGTKFSYYTGTTIEYGRVRQSSYWYDYPYPYPYPSSRIADYTYAGIVNGLTIHTHSRVNLDMFTAVGWRHNFSGGYSDLAARFGLSVGYRF